MPNSRRHPALATSFVLVLALLVPTIAAAQANVVGQWSILSNQSPINPIHVALLPTGKILIASGTENDPTHTVNRGAVYDPRTGTFNLQTLDWDAFCNAMSHLSDGRILIVGGTIQYNPFRGSKNTTIFDPATERFVRVQDMARGRWYPSNTTLADGRTMVFAGITDLGNFNNDVEIYDAASGWGAPATAPFVPPLYPWLHLLPNGKIFFSGSTPSSAIFDPATRTWTQNVATTTYGQDRHYGSSVLLPLSPTDGYRARIMVMGGNNPATATAEMIDLGAPTLTWQALPPMSAPRIEMNAVILPTGKILALGGSARDEDSTTASLGADLFDPATRTWSSAGQSTIARLYHSVALLLPDATVWVAGSNPFQGAWEPRMEIYTPAYLFTTNTSGQVVPATRPRITTAPLRVGYNAAFTVQTPDAADIASAVLIRPGSATHSFDFDQRLLNLTFTTGSGVLNVTSPLNSNVAPPGDYMLFLVNRKGVPSVAAWVQMSPTPNNQPPNGTITNPAADVTISAGQSVTFAGTGTDPDGTVTQYSWVFPGGTPNTSTSATPGAVTFSTPGIYVVSLTVTDNQGAKDPSPPTRTVTVQSPGFTASFSSPPDGAVVFGNQTVGMAVSGNGTAPFTYRFSVDGVQKFTQTTSSTTASTVWNTQEVADGNHTLTLTVTDSIGRSSTANRTVGVQNNQAGAINVALTAPSPGQTVSGTVWVTIWVSGAAGPFSYQLSVGPTIVWTESSANTNVSLPWDTTRTPDGTQTLLVTVRNSIKSGSASVTVNVRNGTQPPPPGLTAVFTSPASGATVSGAVNVGMSASGGTPNYTFVLKIDGAIVLNQSGPGTAAAFSWTTTTGYPNGPHTLTLTVNDGAGASATATRTVTVNNAGGGGGTLTIALTSPSSGQTVSGTTWANIWINSPGTAPYAFTLSAAGATVWSESQSATHVTLPWVTSNTPDGPQTLTVTVRDAAGATGTASVNVIVQNGGGSPPPPLTAAFTAPASGATVTSPVTITMTASGGAPSYTYALTANGSQIFSQTTTATSTSFMWSPTANGTYNLGLTVTDAGARTATATRTVTVNNGGGAGGTVSLAVTSPSAGQTVSGTTWVSIWITSASTPPFTFTLSAAGATAWSESQSATHVTLPWVTTDTPNGPQTLTVTVRDSAGAPGVATVPVTVQN